MATERYDKGLAIRRAALGVEYVDKAITGANDFTRPLQQLVTEYCWGSVWARPGLPRKTRSLINVAMLTALNRPHEVKLPALPHGASWRRRVKLHVRGAMNNGCSKKENMEVLLQTAVYCGIPAATESFRLAREVFQESK